jgi:Flp pilus assembly pilin Flp
VTDTLRTACRGGDGQNIAEYALILALILVLVGGSIRFIAHAITGQ